MSHTPLVHCWVAIFSIWRPVQSLWRTYLSELVFRFEKNNGDRIHGHQTRYRGGVPLGNRRNCTAWRDTGDRMYKWCMRDSLHTTFVIILHVLAILKLKSAAFFLSVKFHLWDFRNMKLWKITSFEQHESGELSHKWKCNELCKSFFFLLFPSYHLCGFARKKKRTVAWNFLYYSLFFGCSCALILSCGYLRHFVFRYGLWWMGTECNRLISRAITLRWGSCTQEQPHTNQSVIMADTGAQTVSTGGGEIDILKLADEM